MQQDVMAVRRFEIELEGSAHKLEAACVECGADLVVVIGGGSRYHIGAAALTIGVPSLKDPRKMTHSSYQMPVPGHKEEALAREGSLILARALQRNVVLSVGIHEEHLPQERIPYLVEQFYTLIEQICQALGPSAG